MYIKGNSLIIIENPVPKPLNQNYRGDILKDFLSYKKPNTFILSIGLSFYKMRLSLRNIAHFFLSYRV